MYLRRRSEEEICKNIHQKDTSIELCYEKHYGRKDIDIAKIKLYPKKPDIVITKYKNCNILRQ